MGKGSKFLIMLLGIGCIIGGIICLGIRAWIQSDEGLNVEPDETPTGKTQQYIINFLLWLGVSLIILGIAIIIYSLII